jgi:hypothetical protein
MLSLVKLFWGLVSLAQGILSFIRDNDLRRQGQTEQQNADLKQEAADAKKKSDITAESRTTGDTAGRLDDGSF